MFLLYAILVLSDYSCLSCDACVRRACYLLTYLTSAGIRCLSVTNPCPTAANTVLVVFCRGKSRQNSNRIALNGGAKCRWGRLNAGAVAQNWRLSTWSVVNLVRSHVYQVYHTVCSTFAVTQCVARVCTVYGNQSIALKRTVFERHGRDRLTERRADHSLG